MLLYVLVSWLCALVAKSFTLALKVVESMWLAYIADISLLTSAPVCGQKRGVAIFVRYLWRAARCSRTLELLQWPAEVTIIWNRLFPGWYVLHYVHSASSKYKYLSVQPINRLFIIGCVLVIICLCPLRICQKNCCGSRYAHIHAGRPYFHSMIERKNVRTEFRLLPMRWARVA